MAEQELWKNLIESVYKYNDALDSEEAANRAYWVALKSLDVDSTSSNKALSKAFAAKESAKHPRCLYWAYSCLAAEKYNEFMEVKK